MEYILRDNFENYVKGPIFNSTLHELLGDGIFNTDGDKWKVQRKVMAVSNINMLDRNQG